MPHSRLGATTLSGRIFPLTSSAAVARPTKPPDPAGGLHGLSRTRILVPSDSLRWPRRCAGCFARAFLVAALLTRLASAQFISVGVTGGVPLSAHSQDYGQGCTSPGPLSCGPNDFFVKPYAIGPTVDVNLPRGISAEVGFLYERFHKDFTQGLTAPHGGPVNFGQQYAASADGWLFPLLLKYNFGGHRITPFVDAGATLRHLGPFEGKGVQLDFLLQPQPLSVHFDSGRDLDVAVTVGAGLRWRISVIDIAPEIRFLHWFSENYQPARNQGMLMLGLTFPARR